MNRHSNYIVTIASEIVRNSSGVHIVLEFKVLNIVEQFIKRT